MCPFSVIMLVFFAGGSYYTIALAQASLWLLAIPHRENFSIAVTCCGNMNEWVKLITVRIQRHHAECAWIGHGVNVLSLLAAFGILLSAGCAAPSSPSPGITGNFGLAHASAMPRDALYARYELRTMAPAREAMPLVRTREFTVRDCPPLSDDAIVVARVSTSNSGAPRTQHPGLDLYVQDGPVPYLIRVHFGDLGDGRNVCLPFNECKNMKELPGAYSVDTARVKELLGYLKARNYCIGKFTSWGVPLLPWTATGSNCGDAFLGVIVRLGIADELLPEMQQWIKLKGGKWAFERGRRRPIDDFFTQRVPNPVRERQTVQAPASAKNNPRTSS